LLVIKIGGTDPSLFDQLQISGDATFAGGTLTIVLFNGFAPDPTNPDMFPIITFGRHDSSDDFAQYNGTDLGGGLMLVPQYTAGGLTLVATQSPSADHAAQGVRDALFQMTGRHHQALDGFDWSAGAAAGAVF
jgi:hypothetical protein